jgi:septin family protein
VKIILLSGQPNTGKTTTMNLLFDELMSNGGVLLEEKTQLGGNPLDFCSVTSFNSQKVVIYSMGDSLWPCVNAIIKYASSDILIMAYSDRFANNLSLIVRSGEGHSVINKTENNDNDVHSIMRAIPNNA